MGGISINRLKEREHENRRVTLRRLTEEEYRVSCASRTTRRNSTRYRAEKIGRLSEKEYRNLDRLCLKECEK